MPRTKVTFDTVRKIGLALPDVKGSTAYGALALKVRGNLLACTAIHKSAEPDSLMVRIDFDQREALLAEAPETYYLTDHYGNYPCVLVRLSRIRMDELRDLLTSAWRFVTSQEGAKRAALTSRRRRKPDSPKLRV
jgi:hypothetical protein